MNPSCPDLRASVASLRTLAERFDVAMNASAKTGDYTEPKRLKEALEARVFALEEQLTPPEIRELHLERQYAEQYGFLESSGILETLSNGEKGIKGIDGREYPVPSLEIVMAKAREKGVIIKKKQPQGFSKLLLVPFGMSLDKLMAKYGERLKAHYAKGGLKSSNGGKYVLNEQFPTYITEKLENADTSGALVYDPAFLSVFAHRGRTKAEILAKQHAIGDSSAGWRVILTEDLLRLPRMGEGQTIGGRRQLVGNMKPTEHYTDLGSGFYANESGLAPEEWLSLAITNLETKSEVTDDHLISPATNLLGAYLPKLNMVPYARWNTSEEGGFAQLAISGPHFRSDDRSVRTSVRI